MTLDDLTAALDPRLARGTCRTHDEPDLWHPPTVHADSPLWDAPREICRACPVRLECLEHALTQREDQGMWGGTTPHERRAMLKRRGRS